MTEKRFEFREVNYSAIVPRVYDAEKQQYANLLECVHWLNDLHKENKQLKQKVDFYKYFQKDARELEKENEELKQFKEDVFDLIDKEIIQNEEAIEWGNEWGADVGAIGFYTNMLKVLRKELLE